MNFNRHLMDVTSREIELDTSARTRREREKRRRKEDVTSNAWS